MKRIVLTGGGTAGHVSPNQALIPHLLEEGWDIHYIGTKNGIERTLIEPMQGVTYHAVSSGKLRRYFDWKNFTDPFRVIAGAFQSIGVIGRLKPNVVFSKGGFVSVPVVFGAAICGVPVVMHESDITPGLANKLCKPFAKSVCTTFPECAKLLAPKGVLTGTPLRAQIFSGDRARGLRLAGFDGQKPVLMMIGGSLAMLVFTIAYKKRGGEYDAPPARFALLAYYGVVIASVTVFMVSCNFHRVGLSISMCYLFAIMIAPTYRRVDTVAVCVLILISWWLPGQLPYAENYDLFKHFLLRFSIIVGFIVLRSIFLRQSANERHIKEMGHAFIKLAYNDVMTETLNKKAMETYGTFIADKTAPERVSVIIFDVDDFKSYNDNYSHMKGDEALRRVAGSVVGVLAAADRYLFRFGGEEFVAILPDIGEEEARRIAGALLDAVRAVAVPREDLPDRHIVTASFGVACGTGLELKDFSLIAKADRQLYICKNNGKNCVAASGAIYR